MHLDKIGNLTEKRVWDQGVYDWEQFLDENNIKGIGAKRKIYYDQQILKGRRELYALNSKYFSHTLPLSEQWRLYDFFREETVFIDIETDGLNEHDDITVVGLYDGFETKTMIRGLNLDFAALKTALSQYKMIVTFNGSVFDLPFIKKRYGKILPDVCHFDLRFGCRRVGLNGGLKEIEGKLGIERSNEIVRKLKGDGAMLHRMWRGSGNDYYLKLLIEYNEEDVINLKTIADHVYQKLARTIFYDSKNLNKELVTTIL